MLTVRPATADDHLAISIIVETAFNRSDEAFLVRRLRDEGHVLSELVALDGDAVVGHVVLSRLTTSGAQRLAALAPLSVRPDRQSKGVGSALMKAALAEKVADAILLLGEPSYYQRFGFTHAAVANVTTPFSAYEAFMGRELTPGALAEPVRATYPTPFSGV